MVGDNIRRIRKSRNLLQRHLRITEMRGLQDFCNIICNIKQKTPARDESRTG